MSQMHRVEDFDQHYEWVAMWTEAVGTTTAAMGLTQLSSARFVALSDRGADLLGTTVEDGIGVSYLDLVEPSQGAAESFRLARQGLIDGVQTRRRLRRPDGSRIEVHTTGWAIRSPDGPDLGLWAASEAQPAGGEHPACEVVTPLFAKSARSGRDAVRVSFDTGWRITEVRSNNTSILGRNGPELLGASLIELIHPDDFPGLLFALARATTDQAAFAVVRFRHEGGRWQAARAMPRLWDDDESISGVALDFGRDADIDVVHVGRSVSDAPQQLRRIADQIEASEVLGSLVEVAETLGLAAIPDLSPRQWEIFARLMRGQRVPAIAAELYLSPSTVRNHLSAIFAKLGVHSQHELIERYRDQRKLPRLDPSR